MKTTLQQAIDTFKSDTSLQHLQLIEMLEKVSKTLSEPACYSDSLLEFAQKDEVFGSHPVVNSSWIPVYREQQFLDVLRWCEKIYAIVVNKTPIDDRKFLTLLAYEIRCMKVQKRNPEFLKISDASGNLDSVVSSSVKQKDEYYGGARYVEYDQPMYVISHPHFN
jgi:hypothetical protein